MDTNDLNGLRVAVLATDGFEESELTVPVKALRDCGARVDIISIKKGKLQAFRHHDKSIVVDATRDLNEARPDDYGALLLPGGALNADRLRVEGSAQKFAQAVQQAGKPLAVICHGSWLLVSAGLVKGRRLAAYHTIQDDIRNAGGEWFDEKVVVDGAWVSSRQPGDLPDFNREMIRVFSDYLKRKASAAA